MKTKNFKNGTSTYKSYLKKVGNGYEVGFFSHGKPLFVGNFIHSTEANQWFAQMKRDITKFSKKYKVGKTFPKSWYNNFLKSYLYKNYYSFLNKQFTKYNRTFNSAFKKDSTKYKKISKKWTSKEKHPALKAA